MLLANRLTHRCTIQRNGGMANAWGTPSEGWEDHASGVPCRMWANAGREVVENTTSAATVEDLRLLCGLDTDVTDRDRIGDVTDRGATILPGPTTIRSVLRHQSHLELILVKAA